MGGAIKGCVAMYHQSAVVAGVFKKVFAYPDQIILGLILVLMLMFKATGLTGGREFVWPFRTVRPLPGNPPTNE